MGVVAAVAVGLSLGVVAGTAFFGGLAWTVRRLPGARAPALLAVGSVIVRLAVVAVAAFAAASQGVPAAVALVAGMLAVRVALVRRAGRAAGTGG